MTHPRHPTRMLTTCSHLSEVVNKYADYFPYHIESVSQHVDHFKQRISFFEESVRKLLIICVCVWNVPLRGKFHKK